MGPEKQVAQVRSRYAVREAWRCLSNWGGILQKLNSSKSHEESNRIKFSNSPDFEQPTLQDQLQECFPWRKGK